MVTQHFLAPKIQNGYGQNAKLKASKSRVHKAVGYPMVAKSIILVLLLQELLKYIHVQDLIWRLM